jgi:hypothetical protein
MTALYLRNRRRSRRRHSYLDVLGPQGCGYSTRPVGSRANRRLSVGG